MSETDHVLTAEEAAAALEQQRQEEQQRSERAVLHVAELWVAMFKSPAGQQLLMEMDRQAEKQKQIMLGSVVNEPAAFTDQKATTPPVSQRDIDFGNGVLEGLSRVRQVQRTAESLLEKRDRKADQPDETETDKPGVWST